jgi:hypothetical protein
MLVLAPLVSLGESILLNPVRALTPKSILRGGVCFDNLIVAGLRWAT